MSVASSSKLDTTVAARIAGEDIARGDFVTVLNDIAELPSFLWCGSCISHPPEEPIRFRCMPDDAGKPLKVMCVCLPFVYTRNCAGTVVTIDIRRSQLVRLDRQCARKVWTKLTSSKRRKKRKK